MISDLREKSQNFVIYLLFGILIFVFIFFFGPQSSGCSRNGPQPNQPRVGWAATVSGRQITQQEVEMMVRRVMMMSDDVDQASLDKVRRDCLLQLIDRAAVVARAEAAGLAVSERDVTLYIVKKGENPDYRGYSKRDGTFDYDRWLEWVHQRLGASPEDYRAYVANELLIRKYLEFLGNQVQVTDGEVREAFDRSERSWNFEYVSFDPSDTTFPEDKPVLAAAEATAWADAHKPELQKYYDDNKSQYDRDKEIKVSRITVRVAKEADAAKADAAKADAKKKAEALLAEVSAPGADFAAVAKEKSEDTFKDEGGDMGWQSRENTSPENYEIFSKLEVGKLSTVQEAPFGFWFARAEEIRPPVKKTLDEVKGDIALILAADAKKKELAKSKADAAFAEAKGGKSLSEIFAALHPAAPVPPPAPTSDGETALPPPVAAPPSAPETGDLTEESLAGNPTFGKSKALIKSLGTLTAENALVGQVLELEGGVYAIVRMKAHKEPTDADFATKKTDLLQRLRQDRQDAFVGGWMSALFGTPRSRAQLRSMMTSGLLSSLPEIGKDTTVQVNEEAFPPPAEPVMAPAAAPKSAGG